MGVSKELNLVVSWLIPNLFSNWQTDQLKAYARSNEKLKRNIQSHLNL